MHTYSAHTVLFTIHASLLLICIQQQIHSVEITGATLSYTHSHTYTALLKLYISCSCQVLAGDFNVPYRLKVGIKYRIFGNMIIKLNMSSLCCSSQQNTSLFHLMTMLIVVSDKMSSFIPVCVLWGFNKGDGRIKKKQKKNIFFSHHNDTLVKLYSLSLHNINVLVISSCLTFSSIFRQQ